MNNSVHNNKETKKETRKTKENLSTIQTTSSVLLARNFFYISGRRRALAGVGKSLL